MKLVLISIVLCAAICVASAVKILSSSSRQLNSRETNLFKRLVKRQAYNDPNCDRRTCPTPNCGKDFVAATLQGECCPRCVPWEYAQSLGIPYQHGAQAHQDPRSQQQHYDPYAQQPQYSQNRVDVYIYGPDEGARVSTGHSIYFDCEVSASYNQYAQPRWTRSGNQPLPHKVQSNILPGNRKIARLTIPDATHGDAGRYECNGGTGNSGDQASIDLQVTDGGYYPRPQPSPQQPSRDPYYQPGYNPAPPQPHHPQPHHPQPHHPQPHHPQPHHPQPQPAGGDENEDDGADEGDDEENQTPKPAPGGATPAPAAQEAGEGTDEGEYPEDYSDNE